MPPLRPCLTCGTLSRQARCPGHTRQVTAAKRARRPYPQAERTRRAAVVSAWRATIGDWCPGWQVAPHHATDLTADHPIAVAAGGREDAPLTVLCRSCNSRKGARGA